jgi:predicted transcriptional regulator
MFTVQNNHNEKLHYNIGHYPPFVNSVDCIATYGIDRQGNSNKEDKRCIANTSLTTIPACSVHIDKLSIDYSSYIDNLDEYIHNSIKNRFLDNDQVLNVNLFARKQYVKISNTVFSYSLKPKVLEFYYILAYITYSDVTSKLSIRTLAKQYELLTSLSIDKDTVHRYLSILTRHGLVVRSSCDRRFFFVGDKIKAVIDSDVIGVFQVRSNNFYLEPKNKWTPYYIGMCNCVTNSDISSVDQESTIMTDGTSNQRSVKSSCPRQEQLKGISALELLLGSVTYTTHNFKYLCQVLNISLSTIYKYLKSLILNNIIDRTKELIRPIKYKQRFTYANYNQVSYKPIFKYQYHNTLRSVYTEFNNMLRESKNQHAYYQAITKRQNNPRKTNNTLSRQWHVGLLGHFMSKYKLKLNNKLLDIQPSQAVHIISRLEEKYGEELNAKLIHWGLVKNLENQILWNL